MQILEAKIRDQHSGSAAIVKSVTQNTLIVL